jgi:Tol biopolymer transport system component/tRNA A-37 threonylcarbamoyl transferase component Bud32
VLTPGSQLGPYDIEATLGAGGAGAVYRARDTRLGRAVAVKVLNAPAADASALRERLQREARAISQLAHPHICTLYDIGVTPDGVSYLVMELIDGETLEQCLARGPLPIAQALGYAGQIADAVGAAHRAGIIHGDLKPGNVMVTKAGVKLLDFGLATERRPAVTPGTTDQVTRTTTVISGSAVTGTLQYLAPEQIEGHPADERTDLFACGAVIYEVVTGRKAFTGQTPASVIAAILRENPAPIATIRRDAPPGLDRVVGACLAKDPDDRWQSASDLARELRWIAGGAGASTPTPVRPALLTTIAAAAALLLTIAVVLLVREYLRPAAVPGAVARSSVLLPDGIQLPAGGTLGGVGRFALSPDGKRLAFVAVDDAGNQMLWLRPIDSLSATPLPGTAGASSPFWSPDSETVAFIAENQLRAVTLPGGTARVIAPQAFNATGSWAGDTILFTRNAASAISQVPASGGMPKAVTTLDAQAGDVIHRSPYFLPDGRHFLYVAVASRTGGTAPRAVYVGSLDEKDGPPRLVMESGSSAKYADGYLIFLRENALVAQPFDAQRLTLTGEPQTLADQVELSGVASATFSLSATGALVYQTATDGSQLTWIDREGRPMETVGEPGRYGDLELSADARQAAVSMVNVATNTRDLWAVDLARGVRSRLTTDRAEDVSPVWSRDGTQIAFASNRSGHFEIYQKPASGFGDEQRLVGGGDTYPAAWAPDGALLFWGFGGTNAGVMRLPAKADEPERWLPGFARQPTLSADGKWVLYVSGDSSRVDVHVTSYPKPTWGTQVSLAGGSFPRWRADGREVYYVARDSRLMAVPITEAGSRLAIGEAHPLFEVRPVSRGNFYAPALDGQRFLVNVLREAGAAGSLTLVQNWSAALRP